MKRLGREMKRRSIVLAASAVALTSLLAVTALAAPTASGTRSAGKPVIGKPVTTPAQAQAGKRFTVTFKVTRSDTGRLTSGKMTCDPSIAGKVLSHQESFKAGIARVSFMVPANAAGKTLKVKVKIIAAQGSAARTVTFKIAPAATKPTAREGHYAGTTSQGKAFTFDVKGSTVSNLSATATLVCDHTSPATVPVTTIKTALIQPDLSFSLKQKETLSDGTFGLAVSGRLTANGTGTGTLSYETTTSTDSCSSGDLTWSVP